ncbi:MAG: phosphodiester glycosidase family protein, partial [Planctomycetota bacterium]
QPTKPDTDLKNVQYALGAYVAIVREGAIFGDNQPGNIAPRSAAGICAEGRYLFLLAIDGRRPGHSLGVTIREAGLIMESLGAHNALNLDGGGSTAFAWLNPHNGDVELLNRPSDRPRLAGLPVPGSSERWNAYHLGIVVADTGEDVP